MNVWRTPMTDRATTKQLACVWNHFKYYHPGVGEMKDGEIKKEFLNFFIAQDIADISNFDASNYISSEIRQSERCSVGFHELKTLENDWGVQ